MAHFTWAIQSNKHRCSRLWMARASRAMTPFYCSGLSANP